MSLRHSEGHVQVVESFELEDTKTRLVVEKLRELGAEDALIITAERDVQLEKAARNLPLVRVLPVAGLNVLDVLARKNLVLVGDAPKVIGERLQ